MREVARSRNLLNGFVTTLKRLFESVVGALFCLLLYSISENGEGVLIYVQIIAYTAFIRDRHEPFKYSLMSLFLCVFV